MTISMTIKSAADYCKAKCNLNSKEVQTALVFGLMAIVVMLPEQSYAANGFDNVLCAIARTLQGPVARAIAAIGIIFLGFSLFLGKISWGVALALGIGIAAVFGASSIVNLLATASGNSGSAGAACAALS